MYLDFYGLTSAPFTDKPESLFLSDTHNNAISKAQYAVTQGTGTVLVTGECGTGKSAVINALGIEHSLISIATPETAAELIALIVAALGLQHSTDKVENLSRIYNAGSRVLVVDECQLIPADVLEQLRLLANDTDLQLILVGTSINASDAMLSRISAHCHIEPLTGDQVAGYIQHRLQIAGHDGPLFDSDAIALIAENTGGNPRLINQIADTCLLFGFADELDLITVDIVRQVLADKESELRKLETVTNA